MILTYKRILLKGSLSSCLLTYLAWDCTQKYNKNYERQVKFKKKRFVQNLQNQTLSLNVHAPSVENGGRNKKQKHINGTENQFLLSSTFPYVEKGGFIIVL